MWGPRSVVGRPVVSVCVLRVNAPDSCMYPRASSVGIYPLQTDVSLSVCLSYRLQAAGLSVYRATFIHEAVVLLSHQQHFFGPISLRC